MEYKAIPQFTKRIDDRTVTGIFAVHGNIDEGNDRGFPGLFTDPTVNGRMRARFLWQHNSAEPPIAVIKSIRDVTRDELPSSVLSYAPDATGGTEVVREYLDTPRGNEVLEGLRKDAIEEMSYAYDLKKYDFEEIEGRGTIRNIYKAALYDISDVNWGMNPATSAAKSMTLAAHSDAVLAAVKEYTDRLQDLAALRAKEGRVLSGENRKRIETALEAMANAEKALSDLLAMTDPGKSIIAEAHQLRAEWQRLQARLRTHGVK